MCREAKITKGQRRIHLDHDHVTGKIRGVLCRDCNCAIGSALTILCAFARWPTTWRSTNDAIIAKGR